MNFKKMAYVILVGAAGSLVACGGGNASGNTTTTAASSMTPMQELSAMPKELHADLEALTKPIDELDATISKITSFPERHKVNAAAILGLAKARVDGKKIELSADVKLDAEAKAELDAALDGLEKAVVALKATPENAAALGKKAVAVTAKLPVLATRISTEANAKAANPFASAESKASAQADLANVQKVQAEVEGEVKNVQAKVTELPQLATKALAKLTTSFAGGAKSGG